MITQNTSKVQFLEQQQKGEIMAGSIIIRSKELGDRTVTLLKRLTIVSLVLLVSACLWFAGDVNAPWISGGANGTFFGLANQTFTGKISSGAITPGATVYVVASNDMVVPMRAGGPLNPYLSYAGSPSHASGSYSYCSGPNVTGC